MEQNIIYIGLIIWWFILLFYYFPAVIKDQNNRGIFYINALMTRGVLIFFAIIYTLIGIAIARDPDISLPTGIFTIVVPLLITFAALPNKEKAQAELKTLITGKPPEIIIKDKKSEDIAIVDEIKSIIVEDHLQKDTTDTTIDRISYITEKREIPDEYNTASLPSPTRRDQIHFNYRDYEGNITNRAIMLHEVDDHYFKGFCLTRNAQRSFRKDRVVTYFDDSLERLHQFENRTTHKPIKKDEGLHCVFMGFDDNTLKLLHALATAHKMVIRQNITKNTFIVVYQGEIDPTRQARITKHNALLMTQDDFIHFVETGEIKD